MSVSVPAADALHSHSHEAIQILPRQGAHLPTWRNEWRRFAELAGPTVLISIGFVVPSFLTAAYVGRNLGPVHLDAYTLANLTGNLCSLSLLAGLYSAADTLGPQAYGAGNLPQVGMVAYQALTTSWIILIPVNVILCQTMGPLLVWLGQDPHASALAWEFYNVYVWSLPFYAVWCVAWKFLSAQNKLRPLVVVTLVASSVVLPLGLEWLGNIWGLLGAALALVGFQAFQVLSLGLWLYVAPPHDPDTWTWNEYSWKAAFSGPSYAEFLRLGVGGMLASLEWIYWEAISLIVGKIGVVPLSVHTVPTQVIYVAFMFPLGIGVAVSNRIGVTLSQSVARAKSLALATLLGSSAVFGFLTWLLYVYQMPIFRLFTRDPEVLEGCVTVWPLVCWYLWVLVLFGINTGIATGLGMQMTLGVWTLVFLWCFGLPASYYFALVKGQGLEAVWTWITPPYFFINLTMLILFYRHDWEETAVLVRIREGLEKPANGDDLESLRLLENGPNDGAGDSSRYGSAGSTT